MRSLSTADSIGPFGVLRSTNR